MIWIDEVQYYARAFSGEGWIEEEEWGDVVLKRIGLRPSEETTLGCGDEARFSEFGERKRSISSVETGWGGMRQRMWRSGSLGAMFFLAGEEV